MLIIVETISESVPLPDLRIVTQEGPFSSLGRDLRLELKPCEQRFEVIACA
jgi:hypothetical protein